MNYDSFATTFSNSRKNLHWPELDVIIGDMRVSGVQSILDIGCGNGRFIEAMKNYELRITNYIGIDNSKKMIEEARKLHPDHHFQVVPMQSIKSKDSGLETYDSILFLASFHHLDSREERLETLKQAKNLLAPGGKMYMTNWNLRDQPKYESMRTSDGEYQIKIGAYSRYYHGFTLDELEGLFRESGYTLLENRIFEGERNLYSVICLA